MEIVKNLEDLPLRWLQWVRNRLYLMSEGRKAFLGGLRHRRMAKGGGAGIHFHLLTVFLLLQPGKWMLSL
jgi:hypothetical protein